MQKSVKLFDIKHLTLVGFFYIFYILRIYIPSFIVYFNHPGDYRDIFMFAVQSVLITFPLGVLLINGLAKFKTKEIKRYFQKPVETKTNFHFRIVFWTLLIFGVAAALFHIFQMKTIPLFYLIKNPGDWQHAAILREGSLKLIPSVSLRYLAAWLKTLILPFLSLIGLGMFLISKKREKNFWGISFIIALSFTLFYVSLTIAKSPVVVVFLMLFIFWYLFKSGRVSKKLWAIFFILVLAFPIFITLMRYPEDGIGPIRFLEVTKKIFIRIFYIPCKVLYPYFEVFPDKIDFLYGRSISLVPLFGQEHFNVPNYVYKYSHEVGLLKGTYIESGNANAAFIGNLWADFGKTGVLLGSFLVGMLTQIIQIFLFRRKKTILSFATFAFLVYGFSGLISTSITTLLLTGGIIIVFILVFIIKILEQLFKEAVTKQSF